MFDLKTISTLNDSHLIENFSVSVRKEREILSEVIAHLSQILKRQLYLKEGYSSLFNYLREKFHYSESAAYRRIQAAKVTLLHPEILGFLEEGKVNLSTLSLMEPQLTKENAKSVIDQIIGKSKREVEYLLAEMAVPRKNMVMQDRIRRLPVFKKEGAVTPFFQNGVTNTAQIFTAAAEVAGVDGEGAAPKSQPPFNFNCALISFGNELATSARHFPSENGLRHRYIPRYIPKKLRLEIWRRDGGKCAYKSSNGKRCEERAFLQFDHIEPWALGGKSTEENLRLLCSRHNRWRAMKTFGRMASNSTLATTPS